MRTVTTLTAGVTESIGEWTAVIAGADNPIEHIRGRPWAARVAFVPVRRSLHLDTQNEYSYVFSQAIPFLRRNYPKPVLIKEMSENNLS
jgi:hypothetical protein